MAVLDWLLALVAFLWSLVEVRFLCAHVVINVVVAVAASVHTDQFRLYKLPDFLCRKLLPYVAIFAIVRALGDYANLGWLAPATWTLVEAALLSDLFENLELLGVPLPAALSKVIAKPNCKKLK